MSSLTPERPPPKKETVYNGPDVYATSSSSNPFPQAVPLAEKKETVYGQAQPPASRVETPPSQTTKQETVFGGAIPKTGQQPQQLKQQQQTASTQTAYAAGVATLSRSANWFFWIAGLSLINTSMFVNGSKWGFLAGLGITADLAKAAQNAGDGTGQTLMVGINVFVAAAFVGIGLVARKGVQWAFILGISIYLLDTVFILFAGAWLMLAFHAWVLYSLWVGFSHCRRLDEFRLGA
jgi:hypothetical protein